MNGLRQWLWIGGITALVTIGGCGPRPQNLSSTKSGGITVDPDRDMKQFLTSATSQLRPENLSISTDLEASIGLLNHWRTLNKAANVEITIPERFLNEDVIKCLESPTFTRDDGRHFRLSVLMSEIADFLSQRAEQDVDRIVEVFYYVMRNIALVGDDEQTEHDSLDDLVFFGQGKALDRAWVLTALLRQMRIDTVVLRPTSKPNELLVGVLLNGQVYLFDPRWGIPLPALADTATALPRRAATLAEAIEHPEIFQALTVRSDQPYPLTSDDLRSLKIEFFSRKESWTPRILLLEGSLPAEFKCLLFDSPIDLPDRPGIVTRISQATGWQPEQISVIHPKRQDPATKQRPDSIASFAASLGVENRKQFEIRVEGLRGKFASAVQRFLAIRHVAMQADPREQASFLRLTFAADDAVFWTATNKMELAVEAQSRKLPSDEEYGSAESSFREYLKLAAIHQHGRWIAAARHDLALCQAERKLWPEARQTLELRGLRIAGDDPYQDVSRWLGRRWLKLATSTESAPPTTGNADPASEKPAESPGQSPAPSTEPSPAKESPPATEEKQSESPDKTEPPTTP